MSKKKLIPVLCAFAVLLILSGVLFLLQNSSGGVQGIWLSARPTGDIRRIEVHARSAGESLVLVNDTDSGWTMDTGEAVSAEKMAAILPALAYLKADTVVAQSTGDLATYGLDAPAVTVRVQYADSTDDTYTLGARLPGSGVYLQHAGDDAVYLLGNVRADVLEPAVDAFLQIPFDMINLDKVVGIRILPESGGEINLSRSESPRSGGDFYWNMTKPYVCVAQTGEMNEMAALVKSLGGVRRVADAAEAHHGIDPDGGDQIAFYDSSDRQLHFVFGERTGDGGVWCQINGNPSVYRADEAVLELFDTAAQSLIDPVLYHYEVSSVTGCTFTWDGAVHRMSGEWFQPDDASQQVQRFTLDGRQILNADYHAFANALSAIEASGIFTEEPVFGEQLGSIEIQRQSAPYEQTLNFYELPEFPGYTGVELGGYTLCYIAPDALDELVLLLGGIEPMVAA